MDIDAAFKADTQLAHPGEPSVRTLHDPAVLAQTVVAFDALASNPRNDAALLEGIAATVDVVSLVSMQFAWPASRTPWFSADFRQCIKQLLKDNRVVSIGTGDAHSQRHAVAIDDQMPFAAEFAAIGWVWACIRAPRGEATLAASRLARLISSLSARRRSASTPDGNDATPR